MSDYVVKDLATVDLNGNKITIPNVKHYPYFKNFLFFKVKGYMIDPDNLAKRILEYHKKEIKGIMEEL